MLRRLVALAALAVVGGSGFAATGAAPEFKLPEIPAEFADAPAIVLLKWENWAILPRSTETRVQYGRRVLIRSERGLDAANQVFTYDAKESYLEEFVGRTICPGGVTAALEKSLRNDELLVKADGEELRVVKFAFSKARPGCIVEWNTTVRYHGTYAQVWWEVQESLPVLDALFVQRVQGAGGDLSRYHLARRSFEPFCTLDEGRMDGSWARWEGRCRKVPALDDEPLSPPDRDARLRLLMGVTSSSLQELVEETQVAVKLWWRDLIKRYTSTKAEATVRGKELGGGTTQERLDRILEFLAREIGDKSDGPTSSHVDELLEARRAYPLERTMLAYALMEGAGLTVVPILLTDRSRQEFRPQFPETSQYVSGARVLLRVEDAGQRIYVDPACRYCRPGYPDWRYAGQGTGGIVLNDDTRNVSMILLDPPSAESNAVERHELVTLREDGSADVQGRVTWWHQAEVDRREQWSELTSEARTEAFLGPLRGLVDGAEFTVDPIGGPSPLEGRFRYTHPSRALRAGDALFLSAGDELLDALVLPRGEVRQLPVVWRYGRALRVQTVFQVPDGYAVEHLPPAVRFTGPGLDFGGSWASGEGGRTVVFTGRIVLGKRAIAVAEYGQAREFAMKLDEFLRQGAVLSRSGGPAPAGATR